MNGYSKRRKNGLNKKLENFTNKDIIKEEAEILTNLLDDITKNLVRPETFDKIRQLKDLSKTQNYRELNQIVEQLTNEEMTVISRYFAILPLLINISEDVDLAYEINHLNNVDGEYLGKLSSTIKEVAKMKMHKKFLKSQYCTCFNSPSNSSATKNHAGSNQSYSCSSSSAPGC